MQSWFGMKFRILGVTVLSLAAVTAVSAAPDKASGSQTVDSGSFGVYMGGKRVATETFAIHQGSSGSKVTSEFKAEAGTNKAVQTSDLELNSNGDLITYEWTETSPGQSHATVVPNQEFLVERFTKTPQEKQHEQPFMLPASTSILDDYFFVQREVLAWKYLATACKQENGQISCPLKQTSQLGTLNAHAQASAPVGVQYSGREKVSVRGTEKELIRLDVKSETGDWTLWLDEQLKVQRLIDPTSNTEVIRD